MNPTDAERLYRQIQSELRDMTLGDLLCARLPDGLADQLNMLLENIAKHVLTQEERTNT